MFSGSEDGFISELLKRNVEVRRERAGWSITASSLARLWRTGELKFEDNPPVNIKDVLRTAVEGSSSEWNILREKVLARGVTSKDA